MAALAHAGDDDAPLASRMAATALANTAPSPSSIAARSTVRPLISRSSVRRAETMAVGSLCRGAPCAASWDGVTF
jgi:hypothetical protein